MNTEARAQQAKAKTEISSSIGDAEPVEWDPRESQLPFPVVAIGASAGGVEALLRFFRALPPDSDCAFVVVMHFAPDRESNLDTLIGRATGMVVAQAEHGMPVQANRVYIAAPAHQLLMHRGCLALEAMAERTPRPTTIDRFMISLAADQGERAIGVVMSGSDGDGSLGIKAIKSEGGYAIAQLPASAMHPGMPLSALATGVVDRQLTVEDMPAAIVELVRAAKAEAGAAVELLPEGIDDLKLKAVLDLVQQRLGLDFRGYKTPMLRRRVRRRMALCGVRSEEDYLRHLSETPKEAEGLAADFLISVTEFFREPDAWRVLNQEVVPGLLSAKEAGEAVRVWVAGCATGEEAYSLAMTLLEHPLMDERRLKLQVFATDIDARALQFARRGCYPRTIHHTVGADRLRRFFTGTAEGYQVQKELREVVMFAPQNLVNDPPFSHLDLVSCRNLLIYMQPELQRRVLEIFHFALEVDGILALGKSETAAHHPDLFLPKSQQARIFRRIGPARARGVHLPLPGGRGRNDAGRPEQGAGRAADYGRMMREALLDHRLAAAVLTNQSGQLLYVYGRMQAYVEAPQGVPTNDLFVTLRSELRPQLRAVLHQAGRGKGPAEAVAVMRAENGESQSVRLLATAIGELAEGVLLVTFERVEREQGPPREPTEGENAAMRALEEELRNTKLELRAVIGELEATNEELKVANEEAMSANEELQSSNEELQTSKEELQAMNEELTTVNNQLMEKVGELETLNDDLNNLLSSSYIPTLFLDRELNIKRFTPAAMRLFRLLPGDIDRPVSDLARFSDVERLVDDARQVLETLTPIERETRTAGGEHFLRRTLPYRTLQDRIEGVVVTFTDITELKRTSESLRRYATVIKDSNDAVIVHDLEGHIVAWNRGAQTVYGYPESEILNSNFAALLPEEARADFLRHLDRALAGEALVGVEMRRRGQDGREFDVSATFSLVTDEDGHATAVALTERDISRRKQMETQIRESEQRFRSLANQAPVLIWISDGNGTLEFVNHEFTSFIGHAEDKLLQRPLSELLHPDDVAPGAGLFGVRAAPGRRRDVTARLRTAAGEYRWVKITAGLQGSGKFVGSMVDIDAQVYAEQGMRQANERKDEFLAMLGHELRNPLVPIRNAAEVLNRVAGEDSRLAWVRDTLVRQVEHVTRLVDDLLDISMITRSTMRLHLEPVDLRQVTLRACQGLEALMGRKRHVFDCTVADGELWVEGDSVRLMQILENLLTNAAKYTDEHGKISLVLEEDAGQAVIHVSDNGMGIEPNMLGRIFDLFVQDARSIDRSQGGLGIGLALVRHLVDLHRGTIRAASEGPGTGTTITVRLPLLAMSSLPARAAPECLPGPGAGRIMVVDDDVDAGESMEVLLNLFGYEVQRAVDLASALEVARRLKPQVVVLDLALPGADGFEVARRLRALPEMSHRVHYLALSGFGQPQDFRRSLEAGFTHHLVKPADPAALDEILKTLLKEGAAAPHD
jgi:two-component system CheB/CheR fusion protein